MAASWSANTSTTGSSAGSDDLTAVTSVVRRSGSSSASASEGFLVADTSAGTERIHAISWNLGYVNLSCLGGRSHKDNIVVISVSVFQGSNVFKSDDILIKKLGDQDVVLSGGFLLVKSSN